MTGMSEQLPRKTKIVATVGPASWDPGTLRALIEAGADVLRLNFSHSDEEKHAQIVRDIRAASLEIGREVAILGGNVAEFVHPIVAEALGAHRRAPSA